MSDHIAEFWSYFLDHRRDLEAASSADDLAYDAVLSQLQRIHPGLYFEFCTTPGENELILTADGNVELFGLVEDIASHAPEIEGWRIVALKPKLGFPQTTCWEGETVTLADVIVSPVRHKVSGDLGLHLYVKGVTPENEFDIHNAVLRAIDSGLGERRFAELVRATWIHSMSELLDGTSSFPLPQLDEYLDSVGA